MIHPSALLDPRAQIAGDASIGPGAILRGRCLIADGVHVGAGAVLDAGEGELVVETGARIGASATIAMPVTIARDAHLMPGTVVTKDVPPHAIVVGNPAEITGYMAAGQTATPASRDDAKAPAAPGTASTQVRGVNLHRLPKILDLRGNLSVGEFTRSIPFEAKRYFLVFDVPNAEIRGEHAHRICHQFLICVHGRCSVLADDGHARQEFLLDDPSIGVHLPPLTWGVQYKYSQDAVLLVFASEFYDPDEYIRDYAEFMQLAANR